MLKQYIRKHYAAQRQKITPAEKSKLEDLMLIQFQKLNLPASILLSYAPIESKNEFNPYLAENFLSFMNENLQLCFPVIKPSTETMQAALIDDDTIYILNKYNILEPEEPVLVNPAEIDVVFVPLLAFDKNGYRVGYGKGYYDKFINLCRADVVKVGFSFFDPIEIDDVQPHDEKLSYCVTSTDIYSF
jgi:5-formyltetrahydrofolate cyclo-ligase